MNPILADDLAQLENILTQTAKTAVAVLRKIENQPVAILPSQAKIQDLPEIGLGFEQTLSQFMQRYAPSFSGSAGSRYLGFVTGGTTPAALAGDWLTSTYDQNPTSGLDSSAPDLERECIAMLRQFFRLSQAYDGVFVSGATMANFVGLAMAREWIGQQHGYSVARDGLQHPIKVFSGAAHSSTYKALAMLGMGRQNLIGLALNPARESLDINALRTALEQHNAPSIVVANAGTVNTVDFDDLNAILDLKKEFSFWLHVDAAFGGFAALSPRFAHLVEGLDEADSICIDAHKWLNVPYDAAMSFSRHAALRLEVFQNSAVYLGMPSSTPDFVHLTPENSRRLRALPAWFSLNAYGRSGYQDIVETCCNLATELGERIQSEPRLQLLSEVRMNVVCFALRNHQNTLFLEQLNATGKVFMTPTALHGQAGIRAAFSNWRTQSTDLEQIWAAIQQTLNQMEET
jgi:glutamate/tyrosine decarboxylase-like PLP-dependent enzyme